MRCDGAKCDPGVLTSQPATAIVEEEEDDGEVDETGVEAKDVELVMTQARVCKSRLQTVMWRMYE